MISDDKDDKDDKDDDKNDDKDDGKHDVKNITKINILKMWRWKYTCNLSSAHPQVSTRCSHESPTIYLETI